MPGQIRYYLSLLSRWHDIGDRSFRAPVSTYDLKVNHKPVVLPDLLMGNCWRTR